MKSKKNSSQAHFAEAHLHYTITMDDSALFQPVGFVLDNSSASEQSQSQAPFKYHADAILGLSAVLLNAHWKTPLKHSPFNFPFCLQAWEHLEPHHQVYARTQERVHILQNSLEKNSVSSKTAHENFSKHLNQILDACCSKEEIDLRLFQDLVDSIFHLETRIQKPLAFNYAVSFSPETMTTLHRLYAFLFHLRALVAVDYNSHTTDATFEALKVDAISDYMRVPDYVTQDAILYHQFKKCTEAYLGTQDALLKKVILPTLHGFQNHSHNAYCLIENLPQNFLNRIPQHKWHETLHLIQMDWLLGTPAGLLFKIREELYGVLGGYEKLFWQDDQINTFKPSHLELRCVVTPNDLGKKLVA